MIVTNTFISVDQLLTIFDDYWEMIEKGTASTLEYVADSFCYEDLEGRCEKTNMAWNSNSAGKKVQ